jgi:hypothetical protein
MAGTAVYDGVILVKDVFSTFVKVGESVECDHVITQCVLTALPAISARVHAHPA